ncbi:nitronate monooxygenase [Bacillus glycinifermentans]|uniref:nitronate monooxygenase n=1 Tax=Bacillus glycinifermentans TaxID=1664069 RepID=UPI001FF119A4|nr:nitronate monooxygenase [Bacillus glycinifermentans]UOY90014.1 nitronate monooxygenase [Bacillus glycinifermentans]
MNEFMKMFSLTKPIIQAPMAGGITKPRLASAVSNQGALGSLASGYLTPEILEQQTKEMFELTDAPFQINVFVPSDLETPSEDQVEKWKKNIPLADQVNQFKSVQEEWDDFYQKIDIILRYKVKACSFTFDLPPEDAVKELKASGCCLIGTASTVEEAMLMEERGMDIVVLQGSEAGGHRGAFLPSKGESAVGLMALVPQAADALGVPVIAAGGMTDHRGVKAALTLGAQGVQIGSAFLICHESNAHAVHKQKVLEANEADTKLTKLFSGKEARGIVNKWMEEKEGYETQTLPYPYQNTLTKPMRQQASLQNNHDQMSLWAGQGIRSLTEEISVKQLLNKLCHEDVKI